MPGGEVRWLDDKAGRHLQYVILRGNDGAHEGQVLMVYRVLPPRDGAPGQLKALRRYPPALARSAHSTVECRCSACTEARS